MEAQAARVFRGEGPDFTQLRAFLLPTTYVKLATATR